MKEYYKIIIDECGRDNLSAPDHRFNQIVEEYNRLDEIEDFLTDRYNKPIWKNRKKYKPVYIDDREGISHQVGFVYHYWNSDISHDSKKWYQSDWIAVYKINSEVIL